MTNLKLPELQNYKINNCSKKFCCNFICNEINNCKQSIKKIRGMHAFYGAYLLKKRAFCQLESPRKLLFLNNSNENIFLKLKSPDLEQQLHPTRSKIVPARYFFHVNNIIVEETQRMQIINYVKLDHSFTQSETIAATIMIFIIF